MVEKYKITKKEEVYELLKDKRNFKYMSEPLLRRLINEMKVIRFTQKTLLLKQDTENRFIYIIIKGKVTVYVEKKALYTLRRTGDVFGELSFATHSPSTASIVAEEGLGVMVISFNYLKKLNNIEFGLWLCHVLGEKLIRTSKLKAIRTTENLDALEGDAPAKNKTPKAKTDTTAEKAEPAVEETEIEDVTGGNETTVETADENIEIEDVLGEDETTAETSEEDIKIEDVTADDENGEEVTAETVAEGAGENSPAAEEASATADSAGGGGDDGDDEDDDGEFMDMNFEP